MIEQQKLSFLPEYPLFTRLFVHQSRSIREIHLSWRQLRIKITIKKIEKNKLPMSIQKAKRASIPIVVVAFRIFRLPTSDSWPLGADRLSF